MNFEVLKRSHLKRNMLIAVLVVALISSLILNFTQAKYRVTESMPLIQGTINFSPSDLNLMAVYLNKNGETISSDKVPHVGYTLNTEQSLCEVNDEKDETIEIVYENGLLNFNGLGNKGTKCTAYFDLIPDSEKPVINAINSSGDDTSITITIDATDNIGIYYYYYQLDDNEEIQSIDSTYTFNGLEKDSVHTITVRVVDAAGNEASDNKDVTVGYRTADYILASANAPTNSTTDWTNNGQGVSYYYTGNPNNWVQFGGFWWRIIRINGDGSIRMIYQGRSANTTGTGTQISTSAFNSLDDDNMYVGYMYQSGVLHGLQQSSTIKNVLDSWYQSNLEINYGQYIDGNAGFCGDRRVSSGTGIGGRYTDYQPQTRIEENSSPSPSLSCETLDIYTTRESSTGNKALTYPIGLISADESIFAGITNWQNGGNQNSYLYTGQNYWTMSPYSFIGGAIVYFIDDTSGMLGSIEIVDIDFGVRPVINLRANVELTGSGTTSDPFKVAGA